MGEINKSAEIVCILLHTKDETYYPIHVLHIFAETVPAKGLNHVLLKQLQYRLVFIQSKDEVPKSFERSAISRV